MDRCQGGLVGAPPGSCYNLPGKGINWRSYLETVDLAHLLVDSVLDKKASDIVLLDIHQKAVFADYFLICNGESERQLRALVDGVVEDAREKAGVRPSGIEGEPEGGWILVDFGDLIVHVFSEETRSYYNLEDLWSDAQVMLRVA